MIWKVTMTVNEGERKKSWRNDLTAEEQIFVLMDNSNSKTTINNNNIQQETQHTREDNSSASETSILDQQKRVWMIALPDYIVDLVADLKAISKGISTNFMVN